MNKKSKILSILLLLLITGTACHNLFRKDNSLTTREYEAMGMPDIGKTWSEKELVKAHATLGALRTKKFKSMPVSGSWKSGSVFSRILSRDNLSFLNDTSMPLHEKAYRIQAISAFTNELGRMYTDNFRKEQYYSNELIEIYIFEIWIKDRMLELADRIMNSSEPGDISMKSGRQAIINGYSALIISLLKNNNKERTFSARQLKKLDKELAGSIVRNISYLGTDARLDVAAEIESFTGDSGPSWKNRMFSEPLRLLSSK